MKTILCYGDSNTFGQIGGTDQLRFPRDVRWTGRLAAGLGDGCQVIEEGQCGRTTVWDDPVEADKNGLAYLRPCLDSHKPLDLVILMLGTNDLKHRFGVSSFDISVSIRRLIAVIQQSGCGPGKTAPQVLLVAPVPIRDVGHPDFQRMLEGGFEKSRELPRYYEKVAGDTGCHFLNPGETVDLCREDGVHFSEQGHDALARLVLSKAKTILG